MCERCKVFVPSRVRPRKQAEAGCRRGEDFAWRWSQVDQSNGRILARYLQSTCSFSFADSAPQPFQGQEGG